MKISILTLDLTLMGGIERVISLLSKGLVDLNNIVEIVSVFKKYSEPFYLIDSRVSVKYLSNDFFDLSTIAKKIKHHSRMIWLLRSYLSQTQSDVLIGTTTNVNIYLAILYKGVGKKIVSEHSQYFAHSIIVRGIRSIVYRFVDGIVTLNTTDFKIFKKISKKTICIPNPVNIAKDNFDYKGRQKIILAVGRLVKVKGFKRLICAFSKIATEIPDWDLKIIGSGPEEKILKKLVESVGLSHRIYLPGFEKNVANRLKEASICCLSSYQECFPMVLIEALAYSIPVISFDCPSGPRDIITDGKNGFLIPDDDEKLFSESITELAKNVDLRERMAKEALLSSKKYSIEVVSKQWQMYLEKIKPQ